MVTSLQRVVDMAWAGPLSAFWVLDCLYTAGLGIITATRIGCEHTTR